MDKKLFADLVESTQRHNEIIAGTRKPAKVTRVDAQSIKVLRAKARLTQEKSTALIPGNRRRMVSRWSIRTRNGCGNDDDGYVVARDSQ